MSDTNAASGAPTPLLPQWSDKQLMLEAEVIVAGQFGIYPVFRLLQKMRDEMQAEIDALRAANAILQTQLAANESLVHATEVALHVKADDLLAINFDLERMTQLERELQEGQAWQVVPDMTTIHCDCGCKRILIVGEDGDNVTMSGYGNAGIVLLPDHIRLCRLVPARQPASDGASAKEGQDE